MMLGTLGRAILVLIKDNIILLSVVFVIWAIIVFWANNQLSKARKMTVSIANRYVKDFENESDDNLWKHLRPEWEAAITDLNLKWIPNKHNLWVIRATKENICYILNLGPEWIESFRKGLILKHRGALPGEEYRSKHHTNPVKTKKNQEKLER